MNPHEWKKEYKPILNTDIDKQIYGPGHNSFVKDENGNDIMDGNLEIHIQSLGVDEQYWLDSGAFDF